MAITFEQTITVMNKRLAPVIDAAGLDSDDLGDYQASISYALIALNHTVADITNPTDSELSAVTDYNHFLDRVELNLLETLQNRLSIYSDVSVGPRSEKLGQISTSLAKIVETKRKALDDKYGVSFGAVLTLGYREIES